MTDILQFVVLGIIQGLTEFIPVSSTGHLVIMRSFLNINTAHGLAVDAVLHLATALAVLVYFRKDIWRLMQTFFGVLTGGNTLKEDRTLMYALIIGTIPAVIAGFFFKDTIETVLRSVEVVAYALIGGSLLFFVAERLARNTETLSVKSGFVIGLFQVLALIPGMSRSGATISGGLLLGLSREVAARFAFLLSFPIILGAGTLKLLELSNTAVFMQIAFPLLVGGAAAFISGIFAIHFLITFLKNNTLDVFIWYRLLLAVVLLVFVA